MAIEISAGSTNEKITGIQTFMYDSSCRSSSLSEHHPRVEPHGIKGIETKAFSAVGKLDLAAIRIPFSPPFLNAFFNVKSINKKLCGLFSDSTCSVLEQINQQNRTSIFKKQLYFFWNDPDICVIVFDEEFLPPFV